MYGYKWGCYNKCVKMDDAAAVFSALKIYTNSVKL